MYHLLECLIKAMMPLWWQDNRPEDLHFSRRRLTPAYQNRKSRVKTLWIASGTLMLIFPSVFFVVSLALFMSFLSFSILDEHR